MSSKINVLMLLYTLCFILIFSVYPEIIPYRSLLIAIILVVTVLLQNPSKIKKDSFLTLIIAMFFFELVSNIINGTNIFKHIIYFFQYSFLIISISKFACTKENTDKISKVLLWTSFIGGPVIGLIQIVLGRYLFVPETADINMFYTTVLSNAGHANSNYAAINMYFCLTLAGYLFISSKKQRYAFAFFTSLICTILTYSRTTIFIMFLIMIMYIVLSKKVTEISIKKLTLFLVGIIIIFIFYNKFFELILGYFANGDVDKILAIKETSMVSLRSEQWKASFSLLFSGDFNAILGYGDNAAVELGRVTGRVMTAHNFILGRLSESGILGFVLAISLYFKTFKITVTTLKKSDNTTLWIMLSTVGMLLCYLMISNFTWELMILLVLFISIVKREETIEKI